MIRTKDLALYSEAMLALPVCGISWTDEQAQQAYDMVQSTPAFLRDRRLSELAPEVTAQRLRWLSPIRTVGEWLDTPVSELIDRTATRSDSIKAVALALDRLRDATPETYVDGTRWPSVRRQRILLSMSRGMVLVRTQPGDRIGWIMRRPVVDANGVTAVIRDAAYDRLAGRDADQVYLEKALRDLGILDALAGSIESVWLNDDGLAAVRDLYGGPDIDYSHLRIAAPSWTTRRA